MNSENKSANKYSSAEMRGRWKVETGRKGAESSNVFTINGNTCLKAPERAARGAARQEAGRGGDEDIQSRLVGGREPRRNEDADWDER